MKDKDRVYHSKTYGETAYKYMQAIPEDYIKNNIYNYDNINEVKDGIVSIKKYISIFRFWPNSKIQLKELQNPRSREHDRILPKLGPHL